MKAVTLSRGTVGTIVQVSYFVNHLVVFYPLKRYNHPILYSMKKAELFFSFLLLPVDYLMIVLAGMAAYSLRFQSFITGVRPVIYALPFSRYLEIVSVMALGWLVMFALAGLYATRGGRRFRSEATRVIFACSTATLALIVWIFFLKTELFSSRFIILAVWGCSIVTVLVGRLLVRGLQRLLYLIGYGVHQVAIVGANHGTEQLVQAITNQPTLGLRVVARASNFDSAVRQQFSGLHASHHFDEVLQLDPNMPGDQMLEIVDWCDEHHVTFKYAPNLFQAQATNIEITTLAGMPLIELRKTPLEGWGRIIKRLFDIIASIILIIVSSPIMLLIAIAVRLDSAGPVIYKNQRMSKNGVFNTYKFRSMKVEHCTGSGYGGQSAEQFEEKLVQELSQRNGPVYKVLNDPRRTRIGRFLERTSLDELPQFFNVLIGNMSLVGPRPHQPREVAKYQRHHKQVLAIKPGITGLAQISGRSDLDFNEEVRLDTYYIENWSLLFDLWILIRTPWVVISRHSKV